ncbi:hypothetical protein [Halovenus marina]|uniref:hypothetical protein n=1 Tax=Halovenus marina TaxID=3396621 RepID=UPI003F56FBA0
MSTTGRSPAETPAASDVAVRLRAAEFVRLVAAATGDGVAAATLLTSALDGETPYQLSVTPLPETAARDTEADCTLAVGRPVDGADITLGTETHPASLTAHEVGVELGSGDPIAAIAGALAAGADRDEAVLGLAEDVDLTRRPGIASPTADPVDGLAHSTFLHAPFSGSTDDAADALTGLDLPDELSEDDHRRVASLAALAVTGTDASERATVSVERFLRPLVGGPCETVDGYADVLDATARDAPGQAVALALGHADPESAFDTWRTHATEAHSALSTATTGRYDGLFAVKCDGTVPVGTVARLAADFRSPEPVVLALGEGCAEARRLPESTVHVGQIVEQASADVGGTGRGTSLRGRARFETDPAEFLLAFREKL